MSRESDFIARLAGIATHPAARGLRDDAAALRLGDRWLVLTHDMIVEGVHYLPGDSPADVAWKLVAVNLSDLAAKGATPLGVLMGYPLAREPGWDAAFAEGLATVLATFGVPLLGGDTVAADVGARQLGLTAIGESRLEPPARGGGQAGDRLYVTGAIGAAGLGLAVAQGRAAGPSAWLEAYRRPYPRLAEGQALAPLVHAMSDISDGLLIDVARMAQASGLAAEIDLARVPLAVGAPKDRAARLAAVTAGDDYELLLAAPADAVLPAYVTEIGRLLRGSGLRLQDGDEPVPLPARLGYEH